MLASYLPRNAASARLLLNLASERGCPAESCLRKTGLTVKELGQPGSEIQVYQEERLIENLVEWFGIESSFAIEAGTRYRIEIFGMFGFAMMSARTLREVLEISLRYQDLAATLARARMTVRPTMSFIELDVSHLSAGVGRFAIEQCFATVCTAMSDMGEGPPPARVSVSFSRPAAGDLFHSATGHRVAYDDGGDRIGFPNTYLDRARPQADPEVLKLCEQQCDDLIHRRRSQMGVAGFVRERLSRASKVLPSMELLASDLNMSVRTLRRALEGEGTSFRELDESVRRERGEELLIHHASSIEQIAEALGYANAPAFVRAFKRSHGVSPGRWRAEMQKTPR